MDARTRRVLTVAGQVLLAGVVVAFVWRALSAGFAASGFLSLRFSLPYLLAAWAALLGYYLAYVGGMWLILRALGYPAPYLSVFKLNFTTNVGKYVPGGIWPMVGRMTLGPKLGIARRGVAAGMVLEAGLSVAGGLLVFFASLATGTALPRGMQPWQWAAIAAIAVIGLLPPVFRRILGVGFRLAKVDAEVPRLSFAATLALVAYFAAAWALAGVAFRLYTMALVASPPGDLLRYAGMYAAAAVGGLVVLFVPGGLGVREGLLALFLTPLVGLSSATVVGFSARVWSTLLELALSAGSLALRVPETAEGPPTPGKAES